MRIMFILIGLVLSCALIYPPILISVYADELLKVILFVIGVIFLSGGLIGLVDSLERKARNNQGSIKTWH